MPASDRKKSLTTIGLVALLLGAWLMATPYFGIRHDAILYTAQALNRLHPEVYGHDLFFRFGSQDGFTVFPALYAAMIEWLGVDSAARVLAVLGKLSWFASLLYFSASFTRGIARWLGLAIVVSYSPYFDSHHVFSYGESFVTARIFAEALVLLALGFMLRARVALATAALVVSVSFHPLVALPGIGAAVLLHRWKSVASLMTLCVGAVGLAVTLAVAGLEPFARLLAQFDPEWLGVVLQRNPYAFLDMWDGNAFGGVVFLAVVLVTGRQTLDDRSRRIADAMLILCGGMLFLSWVGATVFRNVLLTQLQLWRALWLVRITALLLLGALTPVLWKGTSGQRLHLSGLWSAALLGPTVVAGALAVLVAILGAVLDRSSSPRNSPRIVSVTCLAVLSFGLFWKILDFHSGATWMNVYFDRPVWLIATADIVPVVSVTILLGWIGRRFGNSGSAFVIVSGATILAVGAWTWEGRGASDFLWSESAQASSATVREKIPVAANVFWPDGLERTWFWLGRAHYASRLQTAGSLFSRATAVEAARRQTRLRTLGLDEGNPYWDRSFPTQGLGEGSITPDGARFLCQDPELDFLVLPAGTDIAYVMEFPDPTGLARKRLIDCNELRNGRNI
jgi:hypothetical protein